MATQSELVAALRGLIPLAEMSGADNRDQALREARRVLAKPAKLTGTQTALLDGLETARISLAAACKDYWQNIRLPECAAAVPFVRATGAREQAAAAQLVAAGLLVRISHDTYTAPWKP